MGISARTQKLLISTQKFSYVRKVVLIPFYCIGSGNCPAGGAAAGLGRSDPGW